MGPINFVALPASDMFLRRDPQFPQPRHQILLRRVALHAVTVGAQQLEVLDVVLATGTLRNDVVDLKDAERELAAAAVAATFPLAEENLFVLAVRNWLVDVSAPGDGEQPVMQPVTRRLPGGVRIN